MGLRVLAWLAATGGLLVAACSGSDGGVGGGEDGAGSSAAAETDEGCGGAAPPCADGKRCKIARDCQSAVCKEGRCQAPAPDDGVQNGDETDVDCGGKKAPKCAVGKGCKGHPDCTSDACAYDGKCVAVKSCTGHFGGDTCGAGETGTAGAKHESCCTTVLVDDRPSAEGGAYRLDKYHVTAGRMRAFVERWKGDLKAWAATSPEGWDDAWTSALPAKMSDALYLLGFGGKRGCNVKGQGGRTYWQPPVDGDDEEVSDFSKDVLDEKALNCVTWHMAQALCVSDRGRLASGAEIAWVFENGGTTEYPWQWKDTSPYNPQRADIRLVHRFNYATPNPPASLRLVPNNGNPYPLDKAFYIAPPGRHPGGVSKHGVEDAAGNLLHWISDDVRFHVRTFSWEEHDKNLRPRRYDQDGDYDGYYAIGARCSYDP
jgi:hypothetical protein